MEKPLVDVPSEIAQLKDDIRALVNTRLSAFYAKTGLTPSDVQVKMQEVTYMGSPMRSFVVSHTEVRFDL